jgi:hypothetical protein
MAAGLQLDFGNYRRKSPWNAAIYCCCQLVRQA